MQTLLGFWLYRGVVYPFNLFIWVWRTFQNVLGSAGFVRGLRGSWRDLTNGEETGLIPGANNAVVCVPVFPWRSVIMLILRAFSSNSQIIRASRLTSNRIERIRLSSHTDTKHTKKNQTNPNPLFCVTGWHLCFCNMNLKLTNTAVYKSNIRRQRVRGKKIFEMDKAVRRLLLGNW